MNLKERNSTRMMGLMIYACLAACLIAKADQTSDDQACDNTYNSSSTQCTTTQNNNDGIALDAETTAQENAFSNYLAQVKLDALSQSNTAYICQTTLWNAIGNPAIQNDFGSCGAALIVGKAGANSNYTAQLFTCASSPNPTQCGCVAEATLTLNLAVADAQYNKCKADANANCNDTCVPNSSSLQAQQDGDASAAYGLTYDTAAANYTKTTVLDSYTASVCQNNASSVKAICYLNADCKATPANCCSDNANITYDNTMQTAFASQQNAIGAADSTYQYTVKMCNAAQTHDDAIANDLEVYTVDIAAHTKTLAIDLAQNIFTLSVAQNEAQYNADYQTCACNFPTNMDKQITCQAAALVKEAGSLNLATNALHSVVNEPPVVPVGTAYNTYWNTYMAATNTLALTIAHDFVTQSNCLASALHTWTNTYNAQVTAYNNTQAAAAATKQRQLNACGGG
ncbi:MAG TPA: hypothetical protein VHC44_12065 [Verrucomicrobiae bacterium]|nr:hypothetical protein [Verrucomicrobiae bacterium]